MKERCKNLKETVTKAHFQHYSQLNFESVQAMADFCQFLFEHMNFTEKMAGFVVYLGDLVEQSVRYSNLEQFEANKA